MKKAISVSLIVIGALLILLGLLGYIVFLISWYKFGLYLRGITDSTEHAIEYFGVSAMIISTGCLTLILGIKTLKGFERSYIKAKGLGILCLYLGPALLLTTITKLLIGDNLKYGGAMAGHVIATLLGIWLIYFGIKKMRAVPQVRSED